MKHRVSGNVLVRLRAEQDTDGGVVACGALQLIVHADIHVHLPNVLMRDFPHLQVDKHVALEFDIVEDKVDVIVLRFGADVLLSRHEGEASAHFHKEVPYV